MRISSSRLLIAMLIMVTCLAVVTVLVAGGYVRNARVAADLREMGVQINWTKGRIDQVYLEEVRLSRDICEVLCELPELRSLCIELPKDRDDERWLENVEHVHSLRELGVAGFAVTDEVISHLRGPDTLEGVHIYMGDITDMGLCHLACLPGLKWVSVCNDYVTADGVKRFNEMRPDVRVDWSGNPVGIWELRGHP